MVSDDSNSLLPGEEERVPGKDKEDGETDFYREAFQDFDWNHSGTIPTSVSSEFRT